MSAQTEDECWSKVEELERKRRRGERARSAKLTVEDWAQEWLGRCELTLKPTTVRGYRSHVTQYISPRLGDVQLAELKAEDIEAMYAWMTSRVGPRVKASTCAATKRALSAMLNEAIARGRRQGPNPTKLARLPRDPRREVEPLTIDEIRAVLASAEHAEHPARWSVALALGLRQGEALGLRMADLDLEQGLLHVRGSLYRGKWQHGCRNPERCAARHCKVEPCPKGCKRHVRACPRPCQEGCTEHARCCPRRHGGGLILDATKTERTRVVPLPPPMIESLAAHVATIRRDLFALGIPLTPSTPLFPGVEGSWTDPRRDWGQWGELLRSAGLAHTRLHNARHSAASTLLLEGIPARVVMDLMGWTQISLTTRYQHVVDPLRRDAAARIGHALWGTSLPEVGGSSDRPGC